MYVHTIYILFACVIMYAYHISIQFCLYTVYKYHPISYIHIYPLKCMVCWKWPATSLARLEHRDQCLWELWQLEGFQEKQIVDCISHHVSIMMVGIFPLHPHKNALLKKKQQPPDFLMAKTRVKPADLPLSQSIDRQWYTNVASI